MSSRSSARSFGSSRSSNGGSISANGRVYNPDFLIGLGNRVLTGQNITLWIMKRPLNGPVGAFARRFTNQHGLIGKHDYVVIQFAPGDWIKAEKVGDSRTGAEDAGIHIITHELTFRGRGLPPRFQTTFRMGYLNWTLEPLLAILQNHDPFYDILGSNCWRHAFSSAQAILTWCFQHAIDQNVQSFLRSELERIGQVERPMPADVMRAVVLPLSEGSHLTRKLIRTKLKYTVAHLPEDSKRRKLLEWLT